MLTPKNYLSWSQLTLWENSPDKYIEVYLYGAKVPINRGMAYGKEFAKGIENGELTGKQATDMAMIRIPRFEKVEMRLEATLKIGKEEIPLLAFLDTAKEDMTSFKEYKTGQHAWTQKKADEWGQITFYSLIIWLLTGKIPQDIELLWIETATQLNGNLEATGQIKSFKTKRTMLDLLKMQARIKKAWSEIKERMDREIF